MSSFKDRPKPIHRDYSLELVAEELRETILKTPPVDFESVRRARFGIWVMHRLMPRADTRGVQVRRVRLKARDRKTIRCRLYLPDRRDTGAIPGMLFMHWGGFVVGGLETEHARCVRLCREQQLAVLSVDYRKAPEHPFPTGLNDCFDALDWFHQNADSLGVSRNNIGVGGTSAGGGLAASLAVMTRDLDGPSVAWQYLGFPVLDSTCSTDSATRYVDTPNWTASSNLLMWQYYLNGQEPGIAAPLSLETLEGLPPAVIWTAEFDPLRDEGARYASRLWESGCRVHFFTYPGTVHGFDSFPIDRGVVARARREVGAALEEVMTLPAPKIESGS